VVESRVHMEMLGTLYYVFTQLHAMHFGSVFLPSPLYFHSAMFSETNEVVACEWMVNSRFTPVLAAVLTRPFVPWPFTLY
jgi:hypothetical protein